MAVFTSFLQTFEDYDLFHLIGLICGLAIYNLTIVELNFPVALYKKLLKREATLDDLKELMPDVGRSETITCGFLSTNKLYFILYLYIDKLASAWCSLSWDVQIW